MQLPVSQQLATIGVVNVNANRATKATKAIVILFIDVTSLRKRICFIVFEIVHIKKIYATTALMHSTLLSLHPF